MEYFFSLIRIVPDPIKDEALNVGVVVVTLSGDAGDMMVNRRVKSRLQVYRRDFPLEPILSTIDDIPNLLGFDRQMRLGQVAEKANRAGRDRLANAARYLENELQLSDPRSYRADSLSDALMSLYERYVSKQLPAVAPRRDMTAAEMKRRIWNVIKEWRQEHVTIERGGWLRGPETRARHPADYVIKNGTARAAFFALATADTDRPTTHLYRDSLPTIASDMGPSFVAYAVLPDLTPGTPAAVEEFVLETESLLRPYDQVEAVYLSGVQDLKDQVISRLF